MAVFKIDKTVPGMDLNSFALDGLLALPVTSRTSTLLRFTDNETGEVSFYGVGLTYALTGGVVTDVTGGTLSGFTISYAGRALMSVTGLGLSASVFADFVFAENWAGLRAYTFRGNDIVSGTYDSDTLIGGAGNDVIYGLSGRDILLGGTGNDQLNGGLGSDNLQAGAGSDSFVFTTTLSATTNVDKLPDFNHVADTIKLDDHVFASIGALGALGAARFHSGAAAHDASDRVIYNKTTGQVFYDRDGTGAAAKVLFATITAGSPLDHTDFLVF